MYIFMSSCTIEIGVDIWNGVISFDPIHPSDEEWHNFAQVVISESQQPMWGPYPNLPANASTTFVPTLAGTVQGIQIV